MHHKDVVCGPLHFKDVCSQQRRAGLDQDPDAGHAQQDRIVFIYQMNENTIGWKREVKNKISQDDQMKAEQAEAHPKCRTQGNH